MSKLKKRVTKFGYFCSRIELSETCWIWKGSDNTYGYGKFYHEGAHRVSYKLFVGPIPEGLQIDHLCRNRLCVRPDHLEAVTRKENILRGEGITARCAKVTQCPKGHFYDAVNTIINRKGSRICRTCENTRMLRAYYIRRDLERAVC